MTSKLDIFHNAVSKFSPYKNKSNFKRHLKYIFGEYDFSNKTILDIGGGIGLLSIYASILGSKVICLEPSSAGSKNGIQKKFKELIDEIEFEGNLEYIPKKFQDFDYKKNSFDLIVIANAINHLDEDACIRLNEESSQNEYNSLFQKMALLLKNGGKLIFTDCSSSNFFNDIGLKNPIHPSIEWHKHQTPKIWSSLLKNNGFYNTNISWSSFNTLGKLGRIIMGNKLINYMTLSHFRIESIYKSQ